MTVTGPERRVRAVAGKHASKIQEILAASRIGVRRPGAVLISSTRLAGYRRARGNEGRPCISLLLADVVVRANLPIYRGKIPSRDHLLFDGHWP